MLKRLDHLVLTTRDEAACIDFYTRILGMELQTFGNNRKAFAYGEQKINVHVYGHEFEPKAHLPVPGSLDLCFIADIKLDEVIQHLQQLNYPIIEGPIQRTGALGPILSIYLRDPDLNLIEISEPLYESDH